MQTNRSKIGAWENHGLLTRPRNTATEQALFDLCFWLTSCRGCVKGQRLKSKGVFFCETLKGGDANE